MAEQELEIIQGTICAIVFQNYDNGYAVLKLKTTADQTVTVVGTIPLPAIGEGLMVTGRWTAHQNYGRQFEAEFLERILPQSKADIIRYLSGRIIKGIGPKTAARIVEHFGLETLQIMEREPQRLAEVSGISREKAIAMGEEFRLRVGMRQLMEFFTLHQLPAELSVRCYKLYGDQSMEMIYDDPYLLMSEGLDAPFPVVDRFAIEFGISSTDPRRIEAGINFELNYNLNAGHAFLPEDKLITASSQLLSVEPEPISKIIHRMLEGELLIRSQLAGITVIYLPKMYLAETYTTERLLEFKTSTFPEPKNLKKILAQAASESGVSYSPQQTEAIRCAASSSLLLITGGPGTGKTTIVNGILSLFRQMSLKCLLAAPTGRAAQRLSEVTGQDASTIHRLLEASIDPASGKMCFIKDESDPLKADAIIIDEMSMVDISLFSHLLRAVPKGTRVILVGDPDQLPPVGPGFPFSDMLRSQMLLSVRLTEIFRQAQESLIVMNAHEVNHGRMPQLHNRKKDFFFLPCRSDREVAQTVADLCHRRLPQNMGIPSDQIQVLTPTRKGEVGTTGLNVLLQQALNPASYNKKERPYGDYFFREGDRVMQIRNNYDIIWKKTDGSSVGTGIFNGDIGKITAIDHTSETLSVTFDDRQVDYDFAQLGELEPAYAMTVHKSQGSEYRAVVLCAWNGSPFLMNRSVLYTAITRARQLLIIVGREDAIAGMVNNAKISRRYTGLKLRLQGRVT